MLGAKQQSPQTAHFAPPPRKLFTVPQFCERNPAFTEGLLRNLIQYAVPRIRTVRGQRVELPPNGIGMALVRVGRRLFIDEDKFFQWIDLQQKGGAE